MSGVQLSRHGGPEVLLWNDEIPVRAPNADEALVRVLAAGVNNTDINTRVGWYSKTVTGGTEDSEQGKDNGQGAAVEKVTVENGGWAGTLPLPLIQGGDLCGEVVAIGAEVHALAVGMRVTCPINQPVPTAGKPTAFVALGSEFDGAFAQYCTVPANQLSDVSSSPLSDVEIAAIPCAFGTAMNLLARAGVGEGDQVLITGASGGVGLAAVQLARLRGARVTGVSNPQKQEAVRAAGAEQAIGRGDLPEPGSFSVVIDVVGGPDWGGYIEALKPGGRYAVSGAIAGPIVEADLRTIYLNDITLFGCTFQPSEVFAELVSLINAGKVRPLISKTYPLRDIAIAQEDFQSKKYPGKLVLIPPECDAGI